MLHRRKGGGARCQLPNRWTIDQRQIIFPYIGTLLDIPNYTVACILCKIGVRKIRKDKVGVTTSPIVWNDFIHGNLLTTKKMEITQVKIRNVGHALVKIGSTSETPHDLLKTRRTTALDRP